jgi:TgpA N-terminal domain
VRLALLHRRLTAGMALAALAAFAAGDGLTPTTLLAALALAVPLGWLPDARASRWIEAASRFGIVALFAWAVYVAFVLVRDFMPAVLAMLLFLLIAENLRALEAKNDLRLYLLSFSLLIAATAYYPGLAFAGAFAAYIVLATLGLMAGYLRRQAERFRVADLRIGARSLWATAALSGVTLFISAFLFVVFPRLPRQWNVQGRPGGGDAMAGFADEVDLGQHGGRIVANPDVMFRVEFPGGPPAGPAQMYWRGRSFDRFDGRRWSRSPRYAATAPTPQFYATRWGGRFGRVRIFGGPPGAPVLFGPHPVLDVDGHSASGLSATARGTSSTSTPTTPSTRSPTPPGAPGTRCSGPTRGPTCRRSGATWRSPRRWTRASAGWPTRSRRGRGRGSSRCARWSGGCRRRWDIPPNSRTRTATPRWRGSSSAAARGTASTSPRRWR